MIKIESYFFCTPFTASFKTSVPNKHEKFSLTLPAPCILESCSKTFWGTTKKCENENLS